MRRMWKFLVALATLAAMPALAQQPPTTKASLTAFVNTHINANGNQAITGSLLNSTLNQMIATFCGLAIPQDCTLSAGTVAFPGLTGDVTAPVQSNVTTIAPGAVTAAKMAAGAALGNLGSQVGVLAGAASGGAVPVSFRPLVAADLPQVVYLATDARFGTALCAGPAACPTGSGGDDSVPLNACVDAAVKSVGGECFLPPPSSGHYNVCAAPMRTPGGVWYSDAVVRMGGSGAYDVRVLPGCASPPEAVFVDTAHTGPASPTKATTLGTTGTILTFANTTGVTSGMLVVDTTTIGAIPTSTYVLSTTATTVTISNTATGVLLNDVIIFEVPFDQGRSRLGLENVRFNGMCVSDALHVYFDVGQWAHGSAFVNAKAGGADILIYAGYENSFDSTNVARNINSTADGINCYHTPADLPAFGLQSFATDAFVGMVVTNAQFAHFGMLSSGGGNFVDSHGWGYAGPPQTVSGDGQPDLRAAFGYYLTGGSNLTAPRTDDPVVAWIRQVRAPGTDGTHTTINTALATVNTAGTGGTPGYQILTGSSGIGTKAQYVAYVLPGGTIGGSVILPYSLGYYTVAPTFPDTLSGGGFSVAPTVTTTMATGGLFGSGSNIVGGSMAFSGFAPATTKGVSIGDGIYNMSVVGANFAGLITASDCIQFDVGANLPGVLIQNNTWCPYTTPLTEKQIVVTGSVGTMNIGGAGDTGDFLGWTDNNITHYFGCGGGTGNCQIQAGGGTIGSISSSGFFINFLGATGGINTSYALTNNSSGPSLTTCGTSPSVAAGSSNNGGQFTMGTANPPACTVTFANAYTSTAACTVTPATNFTGTYYISAQDKTAFTVALSVGTSSVKFNYSCIGN